MPSVSIGSGTLIKSAFIMASPEKALCDKHVVTRNLNSKVRNALEELLFLFRHLRRMVLYNHPSLTIPTVYEGEPCRHDSTIFEGKGINA